MYIFSNYILIYDVTYLIMIKVIELCENKIIKAITFVLRLKHLLLHGSKIAMIVDNADANFLIVESFYPSGPLKPLSFYLSTSLFFTVGWHKDIAKS